jgi:3D (Asp-Asp-Asp) domain-containing protein
MAKITTVTRLDNVKVTSYTYNGSAENGKNDGVGACNQPVVPGKTIAVDPNIIPYGSLVEIDGVKYLANDTGGALRSDGDNGIVHLDMPAWSTTEAKQYGTQTHSIIVYPPGTENTDWAVEELKAANDIETGKMWSDSWLNRSETLSNTQRNNQDTTLNTSLNDPFGLKSNSAVQQSGSSGANSIVNNPTVTGAGASSSTIESGGIISFAAFAQSLAFKQQLQQGFQRGGELTLHEFIVQFMTKFYHQLYYIPNLRNNYTIVVKPETLFVNAPSCNLIFPVIKSQISYTRSFKQEPTRLIQISDPVAALQGAANPTPTQLLCMMFTEQEDSGTTRNGLPMYKQYVMSLGEHSNLTDKVHPMTNLTEYEKANGIRCSTSNKGADLYLFLKSDLAASAQGADDEQYVISLASDTSDMSGVGNTLAKLARYELLRQRYVTRTGSIEMYFNPYIVPGFPFVSIETTENGLNIYGYVTSVVHSFTDRSWSTTVNFNCAHMDYEQTPEAYPIIESEYASKLPDTYKDMLGENIVPITNDTVPELINTYGNDKVYLSTAYKKIWRETPSLEDYLTNVADGATLVEDNNFWWIQNPSGSTFFNTTLQERIKTYTNDIINNKLAMSVDDVV